MVTVGATCVNYCDVSCYTCTGYADPTLCTQCQGAHMYVQVTGLTYPFYGTCVASCANGKYADWTPGAARCFTGGCPATHYWSNSANFQCFPCHSTCLTCAAPYDQAACITCVDPSNWFVTQAGSNYGYCSTTCLPPFFQNPLVSRCYSGN